jgi:hypothetical protein
MNQSNYDYFNSKINKKKVIKKCVIMRNLMINLMKNELILFET